MNLNHIKVNLEKIHQLIIEAENRYQRPPGSVELLAVSKQQTSQAIRAAFEAGQTSFGENYLQEALNKINELQELAIDWHFIGHIQTNKTKLIAQYFNWVHSIDREEIAIRLNTQRAHHLPSLNVLVEVNLDEEPNKSGLRSTNLLDVINRIQELPKLKLRGLMAIPAYKPNFADQRSSFRRLRKIFDDLRALGYPLDVLSMGMSQDFEAAIAEGSTLVRIGTAIFGERSARKGSSINL